MQIMTGSGTFESYVSVGASCAATPDGRLSGQPIASDCSQQPYPQVFLSLCISKLLNNVMLYSTGSPGTTHRTIRHCKHFEAIYFNLQVYCMYTVPIVLYTTPIHTDMSQMGVR